MNPPAGNTKPAQPACRYTADDVFNYLEDLAESVEDAAMKLHVSECAICKKTLDGFQRAADAAKKLNASPAEYKRPPDEALPDSIGGFKVLSLIAKGGMGKVFKAYDAALDRLLALKVMKDELSSNASLCKRFISEAKTLARLNHPNIVLVHNVGQHEGQLFIAMELIEGQPLTEVIRTRGIAVADAIQTFRQILQGVNAAHEHQIIHRDIKPANIMITNAGQAKILDFGLAKEVRLDSMSTSQGAVLGTLAYMAPEITLGKKATMSSDIYALGLVFYEMLTGKAPFADNSTPFELIERIKNEALPPPSTLNPYIPREIEQLILKMCAKKPENRFNSVKAVLAELKDPSLYEQPAVPAFTPESGSTKFFFCETCGKRLSGEDIDKGNARDKKLKGVYCSKCAQGVLTVEFMPLQSPRSVTAPVASQSPPPAARTKVEFTDGDNNDERPSRRMAALESKRRRAGGRKSASAPVMFGALVAAGVGLALAVMFAFGRNATTTSRPEKAITAGNSTPTAVAPIPSAPKMEAPVSPPNVSREDPSPPKEIAVDLGGGVKMELEWIPVGEFKMGSGEGELPVHKVKISQPFYMGKYAVTQAQYLTVMGANPSHFRGADLPVEQVSYSEAEEFCNKLSRMAGKSVSLPTEAQWEYACRAETETKFNTGDSDAALEQAGWYRANSDDKIHPVGLKRPNAWGLYDMHGNVWEWCRDWYSEDYYSKSAPVDPEGPAHGGTRVLRGGCANSLAKFCRSASRYASAPDGRSHAFGFRVMLALKSGVR